MLLVVFVFVSFSPVTSSVFVSIEDIPSIGIFLHMNVALSKDVDSSAFIENCSILNAKSESSSISLINSHIPT